MSSPPHRKGNASEHDTARDIEGPRCALQEPWRQRPLLVPVGKGGVSLEVMVVLHGFIFVRRPHAN